MPLPLRVFLYLFLGCFTFVAAGWAIALLPHPVAIPGALSVIVAGLWLFWRLEHPYDLRNEREDKGHCLGCGYDLTGNASGVCPECGQAS